MTDYILPSICGITVYTKSECKYCSLIKELLREEKKEAVYVDCNVYLENGKEEFLQYIHQITGLRYRTFPIVFVDGTLIGGFTEMKKKITQERIFAIDFNFEKETF
jgi:glutaredoxin